MTADIKRTSHQSLEDVQAGNRAWWTVRTMSYDWKDNVQLQRFSREWFDEIDRRFLHGARLVGRGDNPFEGLMNTGALAGKRVLEIGCGMGLHAEMLARAGALLTTIDISATSVEATQKRFALKGLTGEILAMDAELLAFPDGCFDLVWSWGVIHTSSRTGKIVREIARVLKPGGTTKIMVYHLGGTSAYLTLMLKYSWGFWAGRHSLDETLWQSSDGFASRFYTRDLFTDILATFFAEIEVNVFGQEADAIPLPRRLRRWACQFVSNERQRRLAARRGSFLYAVAGKPS